MKTCENCYYSEPMVGALACMGQKGMPYVRPTDSCDRWKTMKQTNGDRIRAMTDEELARFLYIKTCEDGYPQFDNIPRWLKWLKQEADDGIL